MNRGYFAYVKESKKAVKQVLKQKHSYLKFYAWMLITMLGRLLILPACVMDLSGVKLSKNVLHNQKLSVFDSFDGATNGKSFWALFVSKILILLLTIAWLAVIGFVVYQVYILVQAFSFAFLDLNWIILVLYAFFALAGLVLVVFGLTLVLKLAPISYVAYSDENVSASTILSKSYKATRIGKGVIFLNPIRAAFFVILNVLFVGIILFAFEWFVMTFISYQSMFSALFGDTVIVLNSILAEQGITFNAFDFTSDALVLVTKIVFVLNFILIVVLSFHLLRKIAKHSLICMVSNYALFEDIVDDKYNLNKRAVGVYVSKNKNVTVKKLKMADVFRSAEDVSYDKNEPTLQPRLLKDLSDVIDFDTLNKDTEVNQ